jgi:hypothetical protein
MSTKIYNGFRYESNEFGTLLEAIQAFRPWVTEQQLVVYEEWVAFQNELEGRKKGDPDYYKDKFWPWVEARKEIKKTGYRNVMVDTDFEIVLFPREKDLIGISFVERSAWHKELIKQPGFSDYGYWDNTDRPKGVSAQEWLDRERAWEKVLPWNAIPAMNGFSIQIADPHGPDLFKHAEAQRGLTD